MRFGPRWLRLFVYVAPSLMAITLASGCQIVSSVTPRSSTDPQARQFHQWIVDLSSPVMEGRGAGTAGLDLARDYVVAQLQSEGLLPAFNIREQPSYTQPFTIGLGVKAEHQSLVVAISKENQSLLEPEDGQFNVLGFSANGEFEGVFVFAGYGIVNSKHDYNSYRSIGPDGLKGKVAVVFRYEPQDDSRKSVWASSEPRTGRWTEAASLLNKAEWAAERGAEALLVVNPPSQDHHELKSTAHSVASQPATIPVLHIRSGLFQELLELAGRDPHETIAFYQRRADRGIDTVDVFDELVLRGRVELTRPKTTVANVAAWVPGAGVLAEEVVVVGAHYDHLGYGEVGSLSSVHQIHPGADDNASGVAALIALAQRLGKQFGSIHGRDARVERSDVPRRSVLFVAFSGEERGLLGSGYFMKHLQELAFDHERLVAMINFDMVGRMKDRVLHVMGAGSGNRWQSLIEAAGTAVDVDVRISTQSFGGSDHTSFLVREVPAIHLFTGSHGDYHRISDTPEKISITGSMAIVDLTETVLQQLLHEPHRMTFIQSEPSNPHGSAMGMGGGAFLGIVPDYATIDGDQGCGLSGVVPHSPAKEAGLWADDVIVLWNYQSVTNVRGLTEMLHASQPGDEVKLGIVRDGKKIELSVTLGRRGG